MVFARPSIFPLEGAMITPFALESVFLMRMIWPLMFEGIVIVTAPTDALTRITQSVAAAA